MFLLYIAGVILLVLGLLGVIFSLGTAGWTAIAVGAVLIVLAYAFTHRGGGPRAGAPV